MQQKPLKIGRVLEADSNLTNLTGECIQLKYIDKTWSLTFDTWQVCVFTTYCT